MRVYNKYLFCSFVCMIGNAVEAKIENKWTGTDSYKIVEEVVRSLSQLLKNCDCGGGTQAIKVLLLIFQVNTSES